MYKQLSTKLNNFLDAQILILQSLCLIYALSKLQPATLKHLAKSNDWISPNHHTFTPDWETISENQTLKENSDSFVWHFILFLFIYLHL